MTDNTAPVQRQLDAYNAKDLAAFTSCYHNDIAIYRMPATEPSIKGRDALAAFYKTERFTIAALRAEVLQRMGEPFFTTKAKGRGTGLGLAIVQQIVLEHQGQLSLSNRPDGGSCVRITLPLEAKV